MIAKGKVSHSLLLFLLIAALMWSSQTVAQPPKPAPKPPKPTPTAILMVPMQDGTKLATDYYLPDKEGPAFPVVLARTPYGRGMADAAQGFLKRGYAVVCQDVRGLGESEGPREAFTADGWQPGLHDGADTVAWIKAQPWCNGKIGTFGGSALGITQVLMAPATQDVSAQCIDVAAPKPYGHMAYQGGVWRKCMCDGWLTMMKFQSTMDMWKAHTTEDSYWADYDAEARVAQTTAPALHFGGWYDIFQQGTIDNFVSRQSQGGDGARGNQRLIITSGAHGSYGKEAALAIPKSAEDLRADHHRKAFFDYWLKGIDNAIPEMPPVYYYVIGDDKDPNAPGMEWRCASTWPPFEAALTPYYFHEGSLLSTDTPTAQSAAATFTYDPANPFPTAGGQNLILPAGPYDQRKVGEGRTDFLTFTTAPLDAPLEITGRVKVHLYISTTAPDTDFTAKLIDVYPSGDDRQILMLDGIQRVKFRNGCKAAEPLLTSADQIIELPVDLWSTSWIFNAGHRIAVHISSSNYPRFEKNPNSGDDWPTDSNLRITQNTIHLDATHPSAIILPIRPEDVKVEPAQYLNPEDYPASTKAEPASPNTPEPEKKTPERSYGKGRK